MKPDKVAAAKAEPGDHWTFAAAAWQENESTNLIKTVCQMKHLGGTGYDNSKKQDPGINEPLTAKYE